jgi:hypothetical protein
VPIFVKKKKEKHSSYTHNFGGIRMTLGNNRIRVCVCVCVCVCMAILTQCHLSWKTPEPIYLLKGRIGYEYRVNIGRHSKTRGVQMYLTSVTKCKHQSLYIKIENYGSNDYAHGN